MIGPELAHAPTGFELVLDQCVTWYGRQPHSDLAVAAGRALVQGLKANPGIRWLEYEESIFTEEIEKQLDLYLVANKYGRQFFVTMTDREEEDDEQHYQPYGLAPAVYSHLLANRN